MELAAVQPADLAVCLVGAEPLVDLAEPVEELVEHPGIALVAHVDEDRHPHDLLDAADARQPAHGPRAYGVRALASAAWSD